MPIQISHDGTPAPFGVGRRRNQFRTDAEQYVHDRIHIINREAYASAGSRWMFALGVDLKDESVHARRVMFWTCSVTVFRKEQSHLRIKFGRTMDIWRSKDRQVHEWWSGIHVLRTTEIWTRKFDSLSGV